MEYPRDVQIEIDQYSAKIRNGSLTAVINNIGKIEYYNDRGELLLEEYLRNKNDMHSTTTSSLMIDARQFKPIIGSDEYALKARFVSNPSEKIYGMGQYQQPYLNLKGMEIELAHRNSQASVPFYISSLGYGFLWNNPAVGSAVLGKGCFVDALPGEKLRHP
jgi:alpha-D-xyloside xylohydrolase